MTNAERCKRYRDSRPLARMKTECAEKAFLRRARLAKRDLDYAESPYAAPVTVEERGNRVIETRGRAVIGAHAAGYNRSI